MTRRLKFYGWGAEGEGLSEPERDHLFGFVAKRLGAEPHPAAPPNESEIALAAPRVSPPAALAGVLTADPLRAAPAYLRQVLPGNGPGLRARFRQRARPRRPAGG